MQSEDYSVQQHRLERRTSLVRKSVECSIQRPSNRDLWSNQLDSRQERISLELNVASVEKNERIHIRNVQRTTKHKCVMFIFESNLIRRSTLLFIRSESIDVYSDSPSLVCVHAWTK